MSLYEKKKEIWGPYILQVAIGIHAVFEGLSIGLETEVARVLGLSLAVVCHKWAEGLTLVKYTFSNLIISNVIISNVII